ncbi:MAG TPA: lipoyl(octanoyl) transferase LipB [Acetobacteraceae bacterium]|jgi:lipoyl(octanoyl) transferase|nr:lipoyl(octanoyl) transferase LipB [Acetobacteraceae bacterium]
MPFDPSIAGTLRFERSPAPVAYPQAVARMQALASAIRAGTAAERVWLTEHPPLYTAGTSARAEDLTDPERFPTFRTGRGGQWTYHGPGQRIAYVMLDLTRPHGTVPPRDARLYVHGLEQWVMRALARLGVAAEPREDRIGLWVRTGGEERKIAAIGVRISRWVSSHGVAINLAPDLSHFQGIVPCGIREHGVTSLAALGHEAGMGELDVALLAAWPDVFGGDVAPEFSPEFPEFSDERTPDPRAALPIPR